MRLSRPQDNNSLLLQIKDYAEIIMTICTDEDAVTTAKHIVSNVNELQSRQSFQQIKDRLH